MKRSLIVLGLFLVAAAARPAAAAKNAFVTGVGQTGLFEIAAGNVALANSGDAGIETYGYLMVTNHKLLDDQLKAIAKEMGFEFPTTMGPANEKVLEELRRLHGAAFNKAYIDHMVEGHIAAVQLFEKEEHAHPATRLSEWAGRSLPMIREHLRLARKLQATLK